MRQVILAGAVALMAGGAAAQEPRVYGGDEVEALRCAHLFAFTSIAMADMGYLSEGELGLMLSVAQIILDRYVTGTDDEKFRAMGVIASRRSFLGTFEEFDALGESCLQRFPPV